MNSINQTNGPNFWKWLALGSVGLLALVIILNVNSSEFESKTTNGSEASSTEENTSVSGTKNLEEKLFPEEGITLPINFGDLGRQMVESGVIDKERFESLYTKQGGLGEEEKKILYGENNGMVKMDLENSGFLLNLFWAFGIGNKNPILTEGPMMKYSNDPSRFASTGGWPLSKGNVMNHYSAHAFIPLTEQQQELVEEVSKNIYRPCCGNPTYFPDCNHGMAMLGLLELMAANNTSEEDMYKVALVVNSYWFPGTYLTIAKYFQQKGIDWGDVDPKDALGINYSSSQGYQRVLSEVEPEQFRGGGSCGI